MWTVVTVIKGQTDRVCGLCVFCQAFLLMAHFHDGASIGCSALESSNLIGQERCPADSNPVLIGCSRLPAVWLFSYQKHPLYEISLFYFLTNGPDHLLIAGNRGDPGRVFYYPDRWEAVTWGLHALWAEDENFQKLSDGWFPRRMDRRWVTTSYFQPLIQREGLPVVGSPWGGGLQEGRGVRALNGFS